MYLRRVEIGFLPDYTIIISWDAVKLLTSFAPLPTKVDTEQKIHIFKSRKKISSHVTHLLVDALRMFLAMVFSTPATI
jgi:hypothetical protein